MEDGEQTTGAVVETDQETDDQQNHADDDEQTYPAKVVKDLRKENASYRDRAKTAEGRVDELSRALFTARVEATGKLASVDDLPFDAALLDDPEALDAAINDLIASHPHYAKRKAAGSIGQNERGGKAVPTDFSGLFR